MLRRFSLLLAFALLPAQVWAQCFPEVSCRVTEPPATQDLGAVTDVATIKDDACGTVKNITAGGAITTNLTNTFTAPNGGNKGCVMTVCNQGTNTITLDSNANFPGAGAANVVLTQDDCVIVAQTGSRWMQSAALLSNN